MAELTQKMQNTSLDAKLDNIDVSGRTQSMWAYDIM